MFILGLKDPHSKERLMEREQSLEKTLQAARIAETSKQHMKSLKEENSRVENVDVVGRKGASGKRLVGIVVFGMHQFRVLLQEGTLTSVGK